MALGAIDNSVSQTPTQGSVGTSASPKTRSSAGITDALLYTDSGAPGGPDRDSKGSDFTRGNGAADAQTAADLAASFSVPQAEGNPDTRQWSAGDVGPYADHVGTQAGSSDYFGQQRVLDCSVIASIKALADGDPNFVAQHVQKVGTSADGKNDLYNVSLYDGDGHKVVHTINAAMPLYAASGTPHRDSQGRSVQDPQEMWGPLLEKAMAAQKGGYGNLNISAAETMAMLTGKPTTSGGTGSGVPDLTRHAVVLSGPRGGQGHYDPTSGNRVDDATPNAIFLHDNHAYAVSGTHTDAQGHTRVTLKNPWADGSYETGDTFDVSPEALAQMFTNYDASPR